MTFEEQQVQDAIDEGQPEEQIAQLRREAEETPSGASACPIDRTKWATEQRGDTLFILVDGLDAGFAQQEEGKLQVALCDADMWPDNGSDAYKIAADAETAVALVQVALAEFWAYCAGCGDETTEEDRALYLPYADTIGAFCANCRTGDPDV